MVSSPRNLQAVFLCVFFLLSTILLAPEKDSTSLIEKKIEFLKEDIIKIRRFLHMNPELSNREFETSRLITSKLIPLGLEIRTGVAKTGVVALLRGYQPGLTVAVRADMDALPINELAEVPHRSLNQGVMHACGHDIHMAVVLGTAMVLSDFRDQFQGNIKFIFQPAEEGAPPGEKGGASLMMEENVLENPEVGAIFGLHVWPEDTGKILFSPGPIMASSDRFEIIIKGKSAHAAKPHEGIDPIVVSAQVVTALQAIVSRIVDPTEAAVVTIGKIQGGVRANVIAENVRLEGTVRTLSESTRENIQLFIEKTLSGITQPFGAEYSYRYIRGSSPVYNHPDLAKILMPTLTRVLGRDNVLELNPQMIAEDFSSYSDKIPGFYFFLGVKPQEEMTLAPLHSPYFNPDERSITIGIRVLCHLLLDSLSQLESSSSQTP